MPSQLQRIIDERAWGEQRRGTRLLLCGSAMSVMGELLAGSAPLRGRASLELLVQPFGYRTAAAFWQISDPKLAVLVHAVVGGTPAYRREFVADSVPASRAEFDGWVERTVLNPAVPLLREARYPLAEETGIREPRSTTRSWQRSRRAIRPAAGSPTTSDASPLSWFIR